MRKSETTTERTEAIMLRAMLNPANPTGPLLLVYDDGNNLTILAELL
jgi:hypothetical protein